MPLIDITTKGRIRLTVNGVELSQHVVETEAIEKALAHANTHGDGTYVLKYPEKHVRVIGTQADPETGQPIDTQAPTKPGTPTEVTKGATFVSVQWTPSVDNVGVTGYQVWLNGVPYGAPTTLTNANVTGQQPATPLTIRVNAFDAAGNQSELSDALLVTTNSNAAPVWNVSQQELTTGVSYTLSLTTVCSDADSNPITFSIVSGTLPTGVTFNSVAKTVSGTPSVVQTQAVTFRADDGITTSDATITFRVLNADTTAPNTPGQPTASNITANSCTLTWSAVTDQTVANARTSGLGGYRVFRDGGLRADVGNATTYNESGLSAATGYDFTVRSYDLASPANVSPDSVARSVTTTAAGSGSFVGANGFSATGTFAQGGAIVVARSGGGLGVAPLLRVYDTFRGGTINASKPLTATVGAWSGYYESDPGGNAPPYRAGGYDGGTCVEMNGGAYVLGMSFPNTGEIYQFYRVNPIPTAAQIGNVKETWWFRNWSTSTNDVCFSWNGPNTGGYLFGNHTGYRADVPSFSVSANWDDAGWNTRQIWGQADGLGTNRSARWYVSHTTAAFHDDDEWFQPGNLFNDVNGWNSLQIHGYWTNPGNNVNLSALWDDVYVATGANAAKRFMLTNTAVWAEARQLYICPHTAWSDTAATVLLPFTPGGSVVGLHLWYFDASNVRTYCGSIA